MWKGKPRGSIVQACVEMVQVFKMLWAEPAGVSNKSVTELSEAPF